MSVPPQPASSRKAKNDAERCIGVYGDKYKADPSKIGQRCESRASIGPYCHRHAPVPDDKRCHARLSRNHPTNPGGPCTQRAMKGQKVCFRHGGSAPQNRRAAELRLAEAELEERVGKILAAHGIEPVDNPLEALGLLAGRALAFEKTLAEIVSGLEDIRYESKAGGEQLRAEVALLERAMDRAGKLLVDIGRLNIDERLVRIEEAKAAIVIAVVNDVIDFLGASGQRASEAREIAARRLEAAA